MLGADLDILLRDPATLSLWAAQMVAVITAAVSAARQRGATARTAGQLALLCTAGLLGIVLISRIALGRAHSPEEIATFALDTSGGLWVSMYLLLSFLAGAFLAVRAPRTRRADAAPTPARHTETAPRARERAPRTERARTPDPEHGARHTHSRTRTAEPGQVHAGTRRHRGDAASALPPAHRSSWVAPEV